MGWRNGWDRKPAMQRTHAGVSSFFTKNQYLSQIGGFLHRHNRQDRLHCSKFVVMFVQCGICGANEFVTRFVDELSCL